MGNIHEMLLYDIDRDTENGLAQERLGEPLTAAMPGDFTLYVAVHNLRYARGCSAGNTARRVWNCAPDC